MNNNNEDSNIEKGNIIMSIKVIEVVDANHIYVQTSEAENQMKEIETLIQKTFKRTTK